MKKTQLKEAFRNIQNQRVSFASIIVIAMLAVTVYLGILYAAKALNLHTSSWYYQWNTQDLQVYSPLLLTKSDVEAIRSIEGVGEAEGCIETEALYPAEDGLYAVKVMTIPERVALPQLLEGRFPSAADECMVEKEFSEEFGIQPGDRISLKKGDQENAPLLKNESLTVTGIFYHADHITYQLIFTQYIIVPEEAFDEESLFGDYTKVRVSLADHPENRFGNEYWQAVAPVEQALKQLGAERFPDRKEDFERELRDAEEKIIEKERELQDAEKQLAEAKQSLEEARALIADGEEEIRKAKEQLHGAAQQLDWYGGLISLVDRILGVVDGKETLTLELIPELEEYFYTYYHDGYGEMIRDAAVPAIENLIDEFLHKDPADIDLKDFEQKYREARKQYEEYRGNYFYSGEQYLDGLTLLEKTEKELAKKKLELEDGEKTLAEKEQELKDGWKALADARIKLADERRYLENIESVEWTVLNNNADEGYIFSRENTGNLSSLSLTFSLLFVLVAALIIYASVGRMVDEQAALVGTTKALGMRTGEILGRYMIFGVLSSVIGMLLGILAARFVLEPLILGMYRPYYIMPKAQGCFLLPPTVMILAGGLVLSVLAVLFALGRLLRTSAIRLMNGENAVSKRLNSGKAGGSLYSRLILMNMTSDPKRVGVTIVSIASCCVLLMIGFSMKYAMSRMPDRQFDGIQTFDAFLNYAPSEGAEDELAAVLQAGETEYVNVMQRTLPFSRDGNEISGCRLICPYTGSLDGFYTLKDTKTGAAVNLPPHGVVISRRASEYYGIAVGNTMLLYDERMKPYEAQVAAVFDNYVDHLFFVSPEAYEEVFRESPENNCFYVKLGVAELPALRLALRNTEGYRTLADAEIQRENFLKTSRSMNVLIMVMTVAAGLMAYFILNNLSGSYMIHKRKELTIMRVNGFTVPECIRYAALELIVTTALGVLIGIPAGAALGYRVVRLTEQSGLQMVRSVDPRSVIFSILITVGFSWLINSLALRKVRNLKLSDV